MDTRQDYCSFHYMLLFGLFSEIVQNNAPWQKEVDNEENKQEFDEAKYLYGAEGCESKFIILYLEI